MKLQLKIQVNTYDCPEYIRRFENCNFEKNAFKFLRGEVDSSKRKKFTILNNVFRTRNSTLRQIFFLMFYLFEEKHDINFKLSALLMDNSRACNK